MSMCVRRRGYLNNSSTQVTNPLAYRTLWVEARVQRRRCRLWSLLQKWNLRAQKNAGFRAGEIERGYDDSKLSANYDMISGE